MRQETVPEIEIYHFDRFYCFTHVSKCVGQMDGYGRTIYVLPPNSTISEPPEEEGQIAVIDIDTRRWVLVESHRGEQWFNHRGEPVIIERPGNPEDFGLTKEWCLRSQS